MTMWEDGQVGHTYACATELSLFAVAVGQKKKEKGRSEVRHGWKQRVRSGAVKQEVGPVVSPRSGRYARVVTGEARHAL